MVRWMLTLMVLIPCLSFAQESTTSLSTSTDLSLTATSSTTAPEVKSPWHLVLGSENYTYEAAQRAHGANAPIVSYNFLGARYNVNSKVDLELRQQFQYVSSLDHLSGRDRNLHRNQWELAEIVLRILARPDWSLAGSKGTNFDFRYYAPTDHASDLNNELGRLRLDAYTEWSVSPQWTFAAWASPRVLLNSSANPNQEVGSDASYYMLKAAPYAMYSMSDAITAYYAYIYVGASSQAQRGSWDPDMINGTGHEVGLNVNYGPVLINPAIVSETNLKDGSGSLFSDDSRAFAYEGLSYNLNVYATF